MRAFEIILTFVTLFTLIFSNSRRRLQPYLWGAILLAAILQITLEKARWQLYPLYIAVLLLTVLITNRKNKIGWAWAAVIFSLLLLSTAAAILTPVPRPFPTTGPYKVGTVTYHLIDHNRTEHYSPEANAKREIMVQVWYPVDSDMQGKQVLWAPDMAQTAPAIADYFGLPRFSLNHLALIKANAFASPPVASDQSSYPVLVFSHGWQGFREQNIYQMEELASRGYVVVGIQHTYGAIMTVFPDGREAPNNPDALPSGVSEEEYDAASNQLVRQWAGDISFTLEELSQRNQSDPDGILTGKLDLTRLGLLGHSTGGGAAVQFCAEDSRCQALLGMDVWLEPVTDAYVTNGLNQACSLCTAKAGPTAKGEITKNWSCSQKPPADPCFRSRSMAPRIRISPFYR